MELRDYIETGARNAGSLTELGKMLGMTQPRISHCKAHKECLAIDAVVKLADYIDADLTALIATNELVTETGLSHTQICRKGGLGSGRFVAGAGRHGGLPLRGLRRGGPLWPCGAQAGVPLGDHVPPRHCESR
jgi:hypothetical protein